MKRVLLLALLLWPGAVSAHDVPDDVKIKVFFKPERDRMLILVRIPANALIDILFPALPGSPFLDLQQIDGFAAEGAKVWVADLLSLYEGDNPLPEPHLLATRISRARDSSFSTYQKAQQHMNGDPLPSNMLLLQDDAAVDALLETPIHSVRSAFSFEPRFGRVGVRVTTTLAFLPADGGIRQFEYEGDPERFELDPTWSQAALRLFRAGSEHFLDKSDYLLFLLCVTLVFRRIRALVLFAAMFSATQSLALIASGFGLAPSIQGLPQIWGVLVAAATVYTGIEAIVAGAEDGQRWALAVTSGLVFGTGFGFALQPVIQFGGVRRLASMLAFDTGIEMTQLVALAILIAAVECLLRLSNSPRVAVIIAAAVAVRISWHQMLDRSQALNVVSMSSPVISSVALTLAGLALAAVLIVSIYRSRRGMALSGDPARLF